MFAKACFGCLVPHSPGKEGSLDCCFGFVPSLVYYYQFLGDMPSRKCLWPQFLLLSRSRWVATTLKSIPHALAEALTSKIDISLLDNSARGTVKDVLFPHYPQQLAFKQRIVGWPSKEINTYWLTRNFTTNHGHSSREWITVFVSVCFLF